MCLAPLNYHNNNLVKFDTVKACFCNTVTLAKIGHHKIRIQKSLGLKRANQQRITIMCCRLIPEGNEQRQLRKVVIVNDVCS